MLISNSRILYITYQKFKKGFHFLQCLRSIKKIIWNFSLGISLVSHIFRISTNNSYRKPSRIFFLEILACLPSKFFHEKSFEHSFIDFLWKILFPLQFFFHSFKEIILKINLDFFFIKPSLDSVRYCSMDFLENRPGKYSTVF